MRGHFVVFALIMLAGCGQQSGQNVPQVQADNETDEALKRRQEQLQAQMSQECVLTAFNTTAVQTGEMDAAYQARLERVNFQNCPNDFVEAFVSFRIAMSRLIEKSAEYSQYATDEREGEAMGQGIGVGFVEWMTGSSTGQTPYANYVSGKSALTEELRQHLQDAKDARAQLEIVAARYGVVVTQTAENAVG